MFNLRTICFSVKPVLFNVHNFKFSQKFCSHANDFKEILKCNQVQKYLEYLQTKGLEEENYAKDIKFHVKTLLEQRKEIIMNFQSLIELEKSSKGEDEFNKMLNEERNDLELKLSEIEFKVLDSLIPELPNSNEVIVEINAGVGGKEAMLFASDLHEMYLNYIDYKNWDITYQDSEVADIGMRHCTIFIDGKNVLSHLHHESGIHRVQRIPVTERHGRIHTSTVTVAVFARPGEIEVDLKEKDLLVETMRSSGAGGQHVNKTESAVRITHVPTGLVAECQTDRSQLKNREVAKQKLCAKLYEIQQRDQTTSMQKSRKLQVGTSARSDKIRTYNYPQDRITDHRLTKTLHNIPGFLEGGDMLNSLISELILYSEKERFSLFVLSLNDKFMSSS